MRSKPLQKIPVVMVSLLVAIVVMAGHASALNTWESNGPTNGRVWGMAIDPINPLVLYAGTSNGLFKSIDGGDSWVLDTGLVATVVYEIAINPNNTSIVYAGMYAGMFKSTNGGTSWYLFNNGITNTTFKSIVIDPSTVTTLYAATYGGGVFKSTDSGGTWNPVNDNLTDLDLVALVIDPNTPATLYAGTYGSGVFKSTTGGSSWTTVNSGLTDLFIQDLAIDPATSTTIYAATYFDGVFRSTNGGASWEAVNTGLSNTYVRALAVNPESTGIIYAGVNGGVFKGSGGSVHWRAVNSGLTNLNLLSLVIDPQTPATVYAGTDGGGVFKTTFGNVTLTAGFTGTGRGTVASDPPGLACGSGCSQPFEFGTYVTLTGTPMDYSTFGGWSGACVGTWCGLAMETDQTVSAVFNLDTIHKALIQYPAQFFYFSTLQEAYNAATSAYPILAWGTGFSEDLNLADPGDKAVTLKGGYDAAYDANNGYTSLHGSLTVTRGSLTVERLAIW
jgi:photosystem II stability/assembly factor-like uncharacterized protein